MYTDEAEANKVGSAQDGTQAERRNTYTLAQNRVWLIKIPNGEGVVIAGIKKSFSTGFTIYSERSADRQAAADNEFKRKHLTLVDEWGVQC
jgi:hypothetical protein